MANNQDIDAVIIWVDGSDPEWLQYAEQLERRRKDRKAFHPVYKFDSTFAFASYLE